MAADEFHVFLRKTLLPPVTGRGDDGLVSARHFFKFFNGLQRHIILVLPEVDIGPGIGSVGREEHGVPAGGGIDRGRRLGGGV